MPLGIFRRNHGWLMWAMVGLAVVAFVGFGLERTMVEVVMTIFGAGPQSPGYHRGKPLDLDEYRGFRQRWGTMFGSRSDTEEQTRQRIVSQMLMLKEAEAAGVVVTDAEVVDRIKEQVAAYSRAVNESSGDASDDADKAFDRAAYEQMLRRYDMTKATYERTLRERLTVEKYQQAMLTVIRPNDAETRVEFDKQSIQLKAKYLSFRSDEFSELSEPTEDEVKEFFIEHSEKDSGVEVAGRKQPGKYYQPNRVAIEYAYSEFKDVEAVVRTSKQISYEQAEKYYRANREDFKNSDEDIKKGSPRFKSMSSVYHEVVNKIVETEAKHIARERMSDLLTAWSESISPDMEDVDSYLKTLAERFKVSYRAKTPAFSQSDMSDANAGPISRASTARQAAFKAFEPTRDGSSMTADEIRVHVSDLLESKEGVYVLRVVSLKAEYKPSWEELTKNRVPGLEFEKVKDDLKVENGFKRAKAEAVKLRTQLYSMALDASGKSVNGEVTEIEANEDGSVTPDMGDAGSVINSRAFKTSVGSVVMPFESGSKRYLLVVTDGSGAKRTVKVLTTDDAKLKAASIEPSDALLSAYYETVKAGSAYKNPDSIETEYLLAKAADFEGDQAKAREALDAVAKDEVITKEAATTKEKAEQRDKIKELAEVNKVRYEKNLDSFDAGDGEATAKILGDAIANFEGLTSRLEKADEGKWSDILDSADGPFMIRVVSKTTGGPAEFADVQERVRQDFLAGWSARDSGNKFRIVWQQNVDIALGKVESLDPIVKKTTKTFSARTSEYFNADRAPVRFTDDAAVKKAIQALKEGELSAVLEADDSYVIGMVRDESTEKKVRTDYLVIDPDDFMPAADAITAEELKEYHANNARKVSAEIEIEYVTVDISALKESIAKNITPADISSYYGKHSSDYYKGVDASSAEADVISDLSDERASEQAKENILKVYAIARKNAQAGDDSLEKAAQKAGLGYKKVKFSRRNVHQLAAHLGSLQGFPQKAFDMTDGDLSAPFRSSTDHFFFRRLGVTPEREMALHEMKDEATNSIRARKGLLAAQSWAAKVITAAKGKKLADAVKAVKYVEGKDNPETLGTGIFGATASSGTVPSPEFRDAAVKLKKGDVFGPIESDEGILVGAVTEEKQETRRKFFFVSYPFDSFRPLESQVTDEESMAAYEKDKESYRKPDQFQLEYLFASFPDLMDSDAVQALATDEALKKIYDEKKETLYKDAQKSTKDKTVALPFEEVKAEVSFLLRSQEAEKLAVKSIADASAKLKAAGKDADFAAVAQEFNLKLGKTEFFSSERPTDPGYVFKDLERVSDLPAMAAELKDGEVKSGDDLKTSIGAALVRRSALKKSYVPELNEVKAQVVSALLEAKAKDAAKLFATEVHGKIVTALTEKTDIADKVSVVRDSVKGQPYLADSVVLPVVRETQLFSRPRYSPMYGHFGSVPGLTGGNYTLQTQFALAAFALQPGEISDPVTAPGVNTECLLVMVTETKNPKEEDFQAQRMFIGRYSQRDKFQAAALSWDQVLNELQKPPR